MKTSKISLLRWVARGFSLASLGLLLTFVIGGGLNPARLTARDLTLFIFFPVGVAVGLIVAWRWEGIGGFASIVSLGAFYALHFAFAHLFPKGWTFAIFTLPALLFVACWIGEKCFAAKHANAGEPAQRIR